MKITSLSTHLYADTKLGEVCHSFYISGASQKNNIAAFPWITEEAGEKCFYIVKKPKTIVNKETFNWHGSEQVIIQGFYFRVNCSFKETL